MMRGLRGRVCGLRRSMVEMVEQSEQTQHIRRRAKPTNGSNARSSGDGVMSKRLTCGGVREMDFDDGNPAGADGVVQGDGCVRVARRIEDDTDEAFISSTTDARDEFAFVVGLHEGDVDVFACSDSAHGFFDVSEGGGAVDGWFAFAEPIEVRTRNDEDVSTRQTARAQASSLSSSGARVRSM